VFDVPIEGVPLRARLYLNTPDSVAAVERLVVFYVMQHNSTTRSSRTRRFAGKPLAR